MNIFVTGGTGFLGVWVVRKLQTDGHKLLLLVRNKESVVIFKDLKNIRYVIGDINNTSLIRREVARFKATQAVCLAWDGIPDYGFEISYRNMVSNINLLQALSELGVKRTIFVGTQWEYGKNNFHPKENQELNPWNFLAVAKASVGFWGQNIMKECGKKFVWLRLFSVYGPGQKSHSLIPYLVNCFIHNKIPEIKNIGGKTDFIYVKDVAVAIASLIKKPKIEGVFNLGSGKLTSVKRVVDLVRKEFNFKNISKFKLKKSEIHISSVSANISKIIMETGWKPQTTIEEGVLETVNYLIKYGEK